jgi:gamma-glutamylputrescine oxidase
MSYSYWQKTIELDQQTIPAPASEPLPSLETDVCIIGGGITGASAAYHLHQAGLKSIVLEARAPAMGASGRNAGMLVGGVAEHYVEAIALYGHGRARELWQFTLDNREAVFALAQQLGVPVQRSDMVRLANSEEEVAAYRESAQLMAEDGLEAEFYPEDPTGRGFLAALRTRNNAVTNPAKLVQAMLHASQAELVSWSPVHYIEPYLDGVRVHSARAVVTAKRAFLATNAYSGQLITFFTDKIMPCRGQIQLSASTPILLPDAYLSEHGFFYYRQVPDPERPGWGRWLMGGARNRDFFMENGHTSEETTAVIQTILEQFTAQHFPEFAHLPIEHRWAGTMGFTQDYLPLTGTLPGLPQVSYAVGFSGHGMALAFKTVEKTLHETGICL